MPMQTEALALRFNAGWRARALCDDKRINPELFLHENRASWRTAALKICAVCPVRAACLDDALENDDRGIRGGTTYKQRLAFQRARRAGSLICPLCGQPFGSAANLQRHTTLKHDRSKEKTP